MDGLEKVGIPVLLQDAAKDLDAAYAQIETLGAATGHVEEAQAVADDMKGEIDELVASAPDTASGATVYHELGPDFFSATSATFIGSIYELLGLENIADEAKKAGTGYPQLSAEYIVKADPDLVVLADTKCCGQTAALVAKRPGWQGDHGRDGRRRRRGERRHHLALGAADGRLRRARRRGARRGGGGLVLRTRRRARAASGTAASRPARSLGRLGASGPDSSSSSRRCSGSRSGRSASAPAGSSSEVLSHVPLLGVDSPFSQTEDAILWELRAPRVVLGLLVGAMLASAGAAYQGVFRNPLADPYLLGAAAGAGLGATLVIVYDLGDPAGIDLRPVAAFVGAVVGVGVAYGLGRSLGGVRTTATLILAGVTVTCFLTAVQTYIQQRNTETVQEVYTWILGRLETSGWTDVVVALPYAVLSAAVLLWHRRLLDVLAVGDEEASTLGVPVARVRLLVVAAATLGTAAAVAFSGLIAFVGIIVPHAIRLMAGTSYRIVLPLSLAVGAGFLVLADLICRTVIAPAELPIGVVTAFFGAPFFAVVLRTTRTVDP